MPSSLKFDLSIASPPEQVHQRLHSQTRISLTPFQGSPIQGRTPLKGMVGKKRIHVGLSRRDWWTLLQPTFRGTLTASPDGGSRLTGIMGIPNWIVWLLRSICIFILPMAIIGGSISIFQESAASLSNPLLFAIVLSIFTVVVSVLSIGWNISHAQTQLPELQQTLEDITQAPTITSDESIAATDAAAKRRQAMAAAHQQKN